MQLFPYLLVRFAGLPFDLLQQYQDKADLISLLEQLQQDIQHPILQRALPYSSIDFLQHLHCFVEKKPACFRKKEFQKGRTALKYLTRTAAKCSPFADFTTLGLLDLRAEKAFPNTSKHLINLELFHFFMHEILENEALKAQLKIRKNPTLHRAADEWAWILNIENQEHLQRAEDDGLLSFLIEHIDNQDFINYADTKNFLLKNTSKAKKWQRYFDQLFEVGIIEFDFPFGKNQHGFIELKAWLQKAAAPSELLQFLDWLLNNQQYNKLNINELKTYAGLFSNEKRGFRPESLFFKDVANIPEDTPLKIRHLEPFFSHSASLYTQLASALQPLSYDKLKNIAWQCLTEAEMQLPMPFFNLYENVFHQEHSFTKKQAEIVQQNREIAENWLMQHIDFQEDIINISAQQLADFCNFTSKMPIQQLLQLPPTANLVLQPISDGKMLLNGASVGYGKQFLRFLHLFDNEQLTGDFQLLQPNKKYYIELNDASLINANEHSFFADFSLDAPNTLRQKNALSIKKIDIKKTPEGCFYLNYISGEKEIIPLDLGLENPNRRSPLYQLLMAFGESLPNFRIFNDLLNKCYENHFADVSHYPQIIIDNQLITQRKHWYIDVSDFLLQRSNESKLSYAERVKIWAKALELPQHIFVSVPFDMNNDDAEKLLPDDYKPQYIDLQNPLLIDLFGKIMKRASEVIKIETMQPSPEEMLVFNNEKRVFELVLQCNIFT